MQFLLFALCLGAASVSAAPNKNLPSSWRTCERKDPNIGECIRDTVQFAIRDLSDNGAKEFGVFPLDPLFMSKVDIQQGKGPVSIDLFLNDIDFLGLRQLKMTGPFTVDVDNVSFQAPIHIPEGITVKGQYKVNGKVLILPITGSGECELYLANLTGMIDMRGRQVMKSGAAFGDITSFRLDIDTSRLKIRLDNLFNGNKELSDNMNVFLNENWRDIWQELRPSIQDAFGAAFREISNRIFSKVPYGKLFL